MSAPASSDDEAQLIALYDSIQNQGYIMYAATALLIFEYLITFGREVNLFWKRRVTSASVLFFANRYIPLSLNILGNSGGSAMGKGCFAVVYALLALTILQYITWAAFSGMRTYALRARHWPLAVVVLLLSLVSVGVNLSQFHWLTTLSDSSGCSAINKTPRYLGRIFTILSRSCLIMSDILVIIVTWFATYRTTRISAEFKLHSGRSFAHTLQRNGTLYFAALLVLNTLHLTFTLCSFATDSLQSISYVTHFSEPITAILVSRFLLDLQGVNQGLAGGVESTLATVGNVTFARIVAPIGSALTRDSVDTAEFEMTEDLSDDVCEKS